ncbi:class I SAM-dependent methyltransferase [Desulfopila sp. IMCC35006]|uniref:class I SAM-dependent methyltransferase n=1 Tax=Desulfopila sp. IMCC35006 TaxID=2569542 RepID=UPI0010AB8B14|nr:class I SAM-dependent methyltransferase [Desulfopila sp. IMCC35006]TKB25077.1 class I SAM-dependent methyltransferase [Desulfopila sp. IMCC35006]
MNEKKFDPKKLHKLNNPARLIDIPVEYIWSKMNIVRPEIFVDIGAGTGFFSIPFLNYVENGKIFACDISDSMIQWMETNISRRYPNIVPMAMTESAVPLEDGIADLVYMINLHHELDDPQAILAESFRILKADGTICIVDWKKEEMSEGPPVHIRYAPEQVEEQLASSDFQNIHVFSEMAKHFLVVAEKGSAR